MKTNEDLQFAFIDEYGDSRLDTEEENASVYYIVTAIIVDASSVEHTRKLADEIRSRHFQTGEMKSSGVGQNDSRRIRVLRDLGALDFHFYSVAVDKREVRKGGGLIYKDPFLKFINGRLYSAIYRQFSNLAAIADQYGRREFMSSFARYVEERKIPDLFRKSTFSFRESKSEPLLQVADFVTGTLGRVFDPKKSTPRASEFLDVLESKRLRIDEWPLKPRSIKPDILDRQDSPQDYAIRSYCLNQAALFLHEHSESKDEQTICQMEVLNHLVSVFRFGGSSRYVATAELKDALVARGLPAQDTHSLRTNLIAKLRDAGVILASSQRGYKIPSGVADIRDFVGHGERIVVPMLNRIQSARDHILVVTKNEIDIIEGDEYEILRSIIKAMNAVR